MAESADVLSGEHQKVILPTSRPAVDGRYGRSGQLEQPGATWSRWRFERGACVRYLHQLRRSIKGSAANTAVSCARPSNAAATLKWAWERGTDSVSPTSTSAHTAHKMGVPLDQWSYGIR